MAGQCGILLLLGVALFLFLYKDRRFLAGAALLLCALEPHFFAPFGIALLLWCVTTKKGYRILAGFGVALAASCALAYALDPNAWSQYSQMVRTGGALNEVVPKLSAELRLLIDPRAVWIQFAPEAVACVWTVWYFWTRRLAWNWMDHGLVLLLVGALCTPYGFLPDESLLLPAILAGVYRSIELRRPLWPLAVLAGAELLELGMGATIISRYYLWTTPAWLCWYLYATGRFPRQGVAATQ
jgi:Glycosyltransferase family 87